jgi:hypothetical protein
MTQGTVGERLHALATDPRFIYPNTDAGKQELLTFLNAGMRKIQTRAQHPGQERREPTHGRDHLPQEPIRHELSHHS